MKGKRKKSLGDLFLESAQARGVLDTDYFVPERCLQPIFDILTRIDAGVPVQVTNLREALQAASSMSNDFRFGTIKGIKNAMDMA